MTFDPKYHCVALLFSNVQPKSVPKLRIQKVNSRHHEILVMNLRDPESKQWVLILLLVRVVFMFLVYSILRSLLNILSFFLSIIYINKTNDNKHRTHESCHRLCTIQKLILYNVFNYFLIYLLVYVV